MLLNVTSDIYYTGPLKIGNEATTRNFLMDSGSDVLWVTSTICATCTGTSKYNPATGGAVAVSPATTHNVTYIDGTNVQGTWYTANVGVSSVSATSMKILVATSSNLSSSRPYEGICGLSAKNITHTVATPLPTVLYN